MALKPATTNCDYIKWNEVTKGATIKGFYMETKPSAKYPNQMNHYLETIDGKRYGLNGSANLDRALEQVKEGWYCEIEYDGLLTLESGPFKGKDCHQFNISYDDERIHPYFGGDTTARQEVAYKAPTETTPPALAKPEEVLAGRTVTPTTTAAPEPAAAGKPKRSIF